VSSANTELKRELERIYTQYTYEILSHTDVALRRFSGALRIDLLWNAIFSYKELKEDARRYIVDKNFLRYQEFNEIRDELIIHDISINSFTFIYIPYRHKLAEQVISALRKTIREYHPKSFLMALVHKPYHRYDFDSNLSKEFLGLIQDHIDHYGIPPLHLSGIIHGVFRRIALREKPHLAETLERYNEAAETLVKIIPENHHLYRSGFKLKELVDSVSSSLADLAVVGLIIKPGSIREIREREYDASDAIDIIFSLHSLLCSPVKYGMMIPQLRDADLKRYLSKIVSREDIINRIIRRILGKTDTDIPEYVSIVRLSNIKKQLLYLFERAIDRRSECREASRILEEILAAYYNSKGDLDFSEIGERIRDFSHAYATCSEKLIRLRKLVYNKLINIFTVVNRVISIVDDTLSITHTPDNLQQGDLLDKLGIIALTFRELITNPVSAALMAIKLQKAAGIIPPPFMIETIIKDK